MAKRKTKFLGRDENGNRIKEEGKVPYWSKPENKSKIKRCAPPSVIPFPKMEIRTVTGVDGEKHPTIVVVNQGAIAAAHAKNKKTKEYRVTEAVKIRKSLAIEG